MNEKYDRHVMVADDDDDDFLIFSIAISEIPFTIILTRAHDGEILMKLLNEKIPDILFLDILMPCKNGHQCLQEIRANRKYDSLPIIIYSSLQDLKNIELCYRNGSNLYVIKPSSLDELRVAVEKILSIDWKKMLYFPTLENFVFNPQ